ncbi:MAG TPA: universal stress protein [Phycisphaerae bacterium]|nr:universal stress protein [Phycisphaerae bacterium]
MYDTILVTLGATPSDRSVIDHVLALASLCHSKVVLLHVCDGWAARKFGAEAVSPEITEDHAYLAKTLREFEEGGIPARTELLYGEPKREILKWVAENPCDLIAMGTHGHRLIGDLLYGATASHIQHRVDIPVLLIRGKSPANPA